MSKFGEQGNLGVRYGWLVLAVLSGLFLLVSAAPAFAFSTGPHEEMLDDAMSAEGFDGDAIGVAGINNTFMDLYQWVGASANPYSGSDTSGLARVLIGNISTENWPLPVIAAATRGHFDSNPEAVKEGLPAEGLMPALGTTTGINAEWERLQRATWTLLQEARVENNPQKALAVLGASTHELQDFYAHTNWIEPMAGHGLAGSDGPGLREHGFGTYPTWFDLTPEQREKYVIYGDSTPGHRQHGSWAQDGNLSVKTGMNKDSPPRPYYLEASITAYFATRQWLEAAHNWLNDDGFWHEMQTYRANGQKGKELEADRVGIFNIMLYSGRWYGGGEVSGGPGPSGAAGDLLELRTAVVNYFGKVSKSVFRKEFEHLVVRLTNPNAPGRVEPVPSSQPLQRQMEIVLLKVTRMASVGAFGLGDLWPDQADMYAVAGIDGERYHSDVMHGHNEFTFGNPYAPFTFYKVLPKNTIEQEPVESIELEVKTGNSAGAGTDDDVSVTLGKNLTFPLNKRLSNDFERGDDDTYSVPIDNAVRQGLTVGDIDRLEMQKSEDGFAGAWQLAGLRLVVNGHQFYKNMNINRWVQNGQLVWQANEFLRRDPTGPKVPVWLELWDDDFSEMGLHYNPYDFFSGENDKGDINPYDKRDIVSYGYTPGKKVVRSSTGGNRLEGRLGFGGDLASITYSLETLYPEVIGETNAVARVEPPDLVITDMSEHSVTVKNVGGSAAGPFRLRAESENDETTQIYTGLAPGASETRVLHGIPVCERIVATVDDLDQVQESNESNNSAVSSSEEIC